MLVELSSLYFHAKIFVGVRDDFEKILGKMDLLKKEVNLREVRCLNKFGLSYGDESMKTYLFISQFPNPLTPITWTSNCKGRIFLCVALSENTQK